MKGQIENKGKVLVEEKKMSVKTFAIIILVMASVWTIWDFFLFCPDHCLLFFTANIVPLMLSTFILGKKYKFIVYENGFDAPIEVYRVLKGEKRFVPFGEIVKIEPYYSQTPYMAEDILGYVISTPDGEEIKIINTDIGSAKMYEEALKKALGPKWNKLYVPQPYGLLKDIDFKKIEKCLSKSSKNKVVAGYILFVLSGILVALAPFLLMNTILFIILISVAFIGGPAGMLVILDNQMCRKKYELLVRFYPDMAKKLNVDIGVYHTPVEKARKLSQKDWEKLESKISFNPFLNITVGIVLMITGILLVDIPEFTIYSIFILISGILILLLSLPFMFLSYSSFSFIKELIKEEYRSGEKILPDNFKIPKWAIGWIVPFRDPSEIDEKTWEKFAKNADALTEKNKIILLLVSTGAAIFSIIISHYLFVLTKISFISSASFFIIFFTPVLWGFSRIRYRNMLNSVIDYERETGKRAIPEKYREKIEKGIRSGYKEVK